jgi:hypothetical protein
LPSISSFSAAPSRIKDSMPDRSRSEQAAGPQPESRREGVQAPLLFFAGYALFMSAAPFRGGWTARQVRRCLRRRHSQVLATGRDAVTERSPILRVSLFSPSPRLFFLRPRGDAKMLRHDLVHGLKNLQTGPVFRRSRDLWLPRGRARFSRTRKKGCGFSKRHELLLLSQLIFPKIPVWNGRGRVRQASHRDCGSGWADNPGDIILQYAKCCQ